jgi:hypothetical protein
VTRESGGRAPRFLVDEMLGRLARWLRLLGCDAACRPGASDAGLARRALDEGRVLLTRDLGLAADPRLAGRCRVVRAQAPLEQLREIVAAFGLDWRRGLFSRCTVCNAPLWPMETTEAKSRVPSHVLEERRQLRHCPACGRVYWQGSHAARMRRDLERALEG